MAKNNIKNSFIKNLKRTLYKNSASRVRKTISVMIIAGLIVSLAWLARYIYLGYAESSANIVLSYPEIALSSMPDNSRFTYYDLISYDNINKALDAMHEEGLYEHFTADDLDDCFFLYSKLEDSAADSVAASRNDGNVFGFVANTYKLTFVQPHDYENESILKKFFTPDESDLFLKALIEANRVNIAEKAGGINAFKDIVRVDNADSYDYSEKIKIYRAKIREIKQYISYINKQKSDFISRKHNLTLKDIESRYDFLLSSDLDSISNFIESSVLSKDIDLAVNKLNVNIENNTLKYNKLVDRAAINAYAMANYDQTFTENLISVVRDETYGLYQARPKTAFDRVVERKHDADEDAADYGAKLMLLWADHEKYVSKTEEDAEYNGQREKCEKLIESFEEKYEELSGIAAEVITEYLNESNERYITATIEKRNIINRSLFVRFFIVFLAAAVVALFLHILVREIIDSKNLKKKELLLHEIRLETKD